VVAIAPQHCKKVTIDYVLALFSYMVLATGHQDDLPFLVEQWDYADRHAEELIALVGDYRVARAAFEEAVKLRPGRIITLRQKTRLLATSKRSTT
jgi:hypothetical protein